MVIFLCFVPFVSQVLVLSMLCLFAACLHFPLYSPIANLYS